LPSARPAFKARYPQQSSMCTHIIRGLQSIHLAGAVEFSHFWCHPTFKTSTR
jgi:hypothetical protein